MKNLLFVVVIALFFWPSIGAGVMVVAEVPELVAAGSRAVLRCRFDLEGETLHSVKWYKDNREFFRFTPGQEPRTRAFPVDGLNVDMSGSGGGQVALMNAAKESSGRFLCEVSADGPKFNTASDSATLTVSEARIRKPLLHLTSSVYRPGSGMKIQCLATPTQPPAKITFLIDDVQVERKWSREVYPGVWELGLGSLPGCRAGPLWLRCEASLEGVYALSSASVPILLEQEGSCTSCPRLSWVFWLVFLLSLLL